MNVSIGLAELFCKECDKFSIIKSDDDRCPHCGSEAQDVWSATNHLDM